jgi:tetratricopeptide (TPR) repeat protein
VFRGAGTPVQALAGMRSDQDAAGPNLRYVRALLESGNATAALARARSLHDANPGAPAAAILLGDCLMANGDYAGAGDLFEQAANMRFDEAVLLRIADAWQRAGKPEKIQRALGLFLRENPMNLEAQRLLAAYMLAAGEHDRALTLLQSMRARIGNEDALLMTQLSYAHIGLGQMEKALPFAAHAYRLAPMNAVTTDAFGWALFKARGAKPEALELLRKAAQLAPQEAQVQRHLKEAQAVLNAA